MRAARSILAVLAGFIVIVILSTAADMALERTIWPGLAHADATTGQWLIVTLYRAVISIFGCWLTATLAPNRPVDHALGLGIVGGIVSTLGLFVMWGVGPLWYPLALILMSIPCAWIGGRLYAGRANP